MLQPHLRINRSRAPASSVNHARAWRCTTRYAATGYAYQRPFLYFYESPMYRQTGVSEVSKAANGCTSSGRIFHCTFDTGRQSTPRQLHLIYTPPTSYSTYRLHIKGSLQDTRSTADTMRLSASPNHHFKRNKCKKNLIL